MAYNDSEIRPFQTDVSGLRSEWAKVSKIYDKRGITAMDEKRLSDDLKAYVKHIARNMDSDTISGIDQRVDSDSLVQFFGKPNTWNRSSAIENNTNIGDTEWAKLRSFLDAIPIAYDDGAGNQYGGTPHVVLTADSDGSAKWVSILTILKGYLLNFLKFDRVELRRMQGELNVVKNDSEGFKSVAQNLPAHLDSDQPTATDLLESLLAYFDETVYGFRPNASTTERNTVAFNRDISYGAIINDSDTNNFSDSDTNRGRLYYLRRKLATAVVAGIMLDSDFTDAGHTRTYGANLLASRLGGTYQTVTRRSAPLHQGNFNLFYQYLNFDWIARDSEFSGGAGVAGTIDANFGKGNLVDSDSEGYSLNYSKHVTPGVTITSIDDSDVVSLFTARNQFYWGFMGLRLGATDSDKLALLLDSDYKARTTGGGKRPNSNYYSYHPSFLKKFKQINKSFTERQLLGYLNRVEDSDKKLHRSKVWQPLSEYVRGNDSDLEIFRRSILTSLNDSDRVTIANDVVMRAIDSDSDDGLSIKNRLTDIVMNQLVNQDSENSLIGRIARKEIFKMDSDSELVSRTFTHLLNRISESAVASDSDSMGRDSDLRVRFDNLILDRVQRLDSDDLNSGTNLKATLRKDYIQAYDSDSDLQKRSAIGAIQAMRDDSDILKTQLSTLRSKLKTITQEHIVNDSEGSYSSFQFTMPKGNHPPANTDVSVFLNGVLQMNSTSQNKLGTAAVNHTVDISSSAVSATGLITINFAVNVPIADVITIKYTTYQK